MNIVESLRTSLEAITSNKLRTALTMLGIIIGVAAVIALMSLGAGVENMVSDEISGMGSNLIAIGPSQPEDSSEPALLTIADATKLADPFNVPQARRVSAEVSGKLRVAYEGEREELTVKGVNADYDNIHNIELAGGGFLTDADIQEQARVVVLGSEAYTELFGEEYPLEATITIDGVRFRVVGVAEEQGGMMSNDSSVFIPLTTAHSRFFSNRALSGDYIVSAISVEAMSEETAAIAVAQIETALREAHGIAEGDEDDFRVYSQQEILDMASSITGVLTTFLGAIAGISLLVGGIGIMNIMLVTVTERTREIGIRKAVGATSGVVLTQFLVEALVLTLGGGLIGMVLGIIGSNALAPLIDVTASVTGGVLLLAIGVSTAVGLLFGVYPAMRAAQLNPIQALRYE